MSTWWYLEGADKRRFCWSRDPTFECPHSITLYDVVDLATGKIVSSAVRMQTEAVGITFRRHVTAQMAQAAEILGVDGVKLAHLIQRSHRQGTKRERVDGKLTDTCGHCGAKMKRYGFRCWIERPANAEERRKPGAQLTAAMGNEPTVTVKSFFMKTKREAEGWAREEVALTRKKAEATH